MDTLLFIADIHIKLGQKNVPEEWARNRYRMFIEKLDVLQNEVDYVVLGGDVFDRVPTMDEVEIYFDLISVFKKPTRIIPGNHEALKKDTTFLSRLSRATKNVNNLVDIITDFTTLDGVDYIPYNRLKEYHPADVDFSSNVLITHVRGEIPPHVKPEVPLELFSRWDVVLAGDLHSYENSQRNILYPGSPMSTSFHRSPVENGVIIFNTKTLKHKFVPLGLPQLIRKTIQVGEPMPATDYDHTIYQVEGDVSSLQKIENTELLDKKVAKRESDVALMLEPDMTLSEELREYLLYILGLPEDTTNEILLEYIGMEAKINADV